MARANAASASAHAEALRQLARILSASVTAQKPRLGGWGHRAIPIGVALFLLLVMITAALQTMQARDQAILAARGELELIASTVAAEISAARTTPLDLAALETTLPERVLRNERYILVSNADGDINATLPRARDAKGALASQLGAGQALITFAEKAGVLSIVLDHGEEALATVRNLPRSQGQVAVIHPIHGVLTDWRATVLRANILLFITAGVLALAAAAFARQSGATRKSQTAFETLRERMNAALSRGRCGLWDWDLSRGRIYWSASMYEVVGLTPSQDRLSCGDIDKLLHPEDDDLASIAQALAASGATSLDHTFRLRHGAGHWVWVRVRAEITNDAANDTAHLVGIAMDITDQQALAESQVTFLPPGKGTATATDCPVSQQSGMDQCRIAPGRIDAISAIKRTHPTGRVIEQSITFVGPAPDFIESSLGQVKESTPDQVGRALASTGTEIAPLHQKGAIARRGKAAKRTGPNHPTSDHNYINVRRASAEPRLASLTGNGHLVGGNELPLRSERQLR